MLEDIVKQLLHPLVRRGICLSNIRLPQWIFLWETRFELIVGKLLMNVCLVASPVTRMLTNGFAKKLWLLAGAWIEPGESKPL